MVGRKSLSRLFVAFGPHLQENKENPVFMEYNRHPFKKQGGGDAKPVQI